MSRSEIRIPGIGIREKYARLKRIYAQTKIKTHNLMVKYQPTIEYAILNMPLFVAAPWMLFTMGKGLSTPFVFVPGFCNLAHIIYENLSSVISKIKGRNQELSDRFKGEINELKKTIGLFTNKLINQLTTNLGLDVINYTLDDHEISHSFEDLFKQVSFADFSHPAKLEEIKKKLTDLLRERIGIKPNDIRLQNILKELIEQEKIVPKMQDTLFSLREKIENYLTEEAKSDLGKEKTDLSDIISDKPKDKSDETQK